MCPARVSSAVCQLRELQALQNLVFHVLSAVAVERDALGRGRRQLLVQRATQLEGPSRPPRWASVIGCKVREKVPRSALSRADTGTSRRVRHLCMIGGTSTP